MISSLSRVSLALILFLLLSVTSRPVSAADDEDEGLPILQSGTAAVDLNTQRLSISYSTTIAGPLVEVRPLIDRLGGELQMGPLGEAHTLTLNDRTFEFGPDSDALTSGEEIIDLSQAARGGGEIGLQVPLDLLDNIYGLALGYEFTWNPAARMLMVRHQSSRELDLQFNLVQVQGVTTVVFQFSTRPRYRLRETNRSVTIELIGDRLTERSARPTPNDELVRGIVLARDGIRLQLAAGTTFENYILDEPFRLVFDVFRGSQRRSDGNPAPELVNPRRERRSGVRTIILDPGHGGSDPGAVGPSGAEEKRLVLQLAASVRQLLLERLPVRVVMTRSNDAQIPLESRAALANQSKGDLFVSLHLNSSAGGGARGAETYTLTLDTKGDADAQAAATSSVGSQGGDPLFDLQLQLWELSQRRHVGSSRVFAGLVQEELNSALESNRPVRRAPLRVLKGVAMPAILVELGFLSNAEEEASLKDPEYRVRLADALVKGITRYRAQVMNLDLPDQAAAPEPTP